MAPFLCFLATSWGTGSFCLNYSGLTTPFCKKKIIMNSFKNPKSLSIVQNYTPRRSARIANLEHKENKSSTFVKLNAQSRKTSKIPHKEASAPVQSHCDIDFKFVQNYNINIESKVDDGRIPLDTVDCNASSPKQHPIRNSNVPPTKERNKK